MSSVPYRVSKVTAVIVLVAWALAFLVAIKLSWVVFLALAVLVTWVLSGIGLVCGLVGVRARDRRWQSSVLAFLHFLLLAWTVLLILSFGWH
jgi:hypothetical protein